MQNDRKKTKHMLWNGIYFYAPRYIWIVKKSTKMSTLKFPIPCLANWSFCFTFSLIISWIFQFRFISNISGQNLSLFLHFVIMNGQRLLLNVTSNSVWFWSILEGTYFHSHAFNSVNDLEKWSILEYRYWQIEFQWVINEYFCPFDTLDYVIGL